MHLRFTKIHRGRSIRLVTEGLGKSPFHGNVSILADESSRGASEMVVAFVKQYRLANVIGSTTPGETLGAANFRVSDNYQLRIPLVGWYLPDGRMIEGKGVSPDHSITPTLEGLRAGQDEVLDKAIALSA
jgi:C-terminal processing protease CtpA/Prc